MSSHDKSSASSLIVRPRPRPKIGVLVETERGSGRSIISGIIRYAQEHGPWEFVYEPGEVTPKILRRFAHATGLIVEPKQRGIIKALKTIGKPTMLVNDSKSRVGFPRVVEDGSVIGTMALEYFLELGLEQFAYVGATSAWTSKARWEGFRNAAANLPLELFKIKGTYGVVSISKPLRCWLSGLVKPVGLFVSSTIYARMVLEACADEDIAVPEQVAVLTAGHDPILCRLTNPPLSCINTGSLRMGYIAAQLLDRVLHGERVSEEPVVVPPVGIEQRHSTDTMAIRNSDVSRALRLIRDHASEGLGVADLLRQLPVCRRTLEMHFQQHLGRTIHQEIVRTRMTRVRMLLIETDLDLVDIAVRCGLKSISHLSRLFKKYTGQSPRAFRQAHRERSI